MLELFQKAGWVAYPLALCSVLALGIILERFFTLARLKAIEDAAFPVLRESLLKGKDPVLGDPALDAAPVTQVVNTLSEMRGSKEESLQYAAELSISLQRTRLRRYLGTLATIGSTAPFIGLFGTVLGIMRSFHSMSQGGLNSEAMAGGIAEALSATALGLLVAVPAVIAYNYFNGRVQALVLQIHGHVARLAPLLSGSEERLPARERQGV